MRPQTATAPESPPNLAAAAVGLLALGVGLAAPAQAAGQDTFSMSTPGWDGGHHSADPFAPGSGSGAWHGSHAHHGQNWDRQTSPEGGGWFIPRNDSPVAPAERFAFEVQEGTADLGAVKVLDNTRGRLRTLRLQWPDEDDPRARGAHESMFRDLVTRTDASVQFEIVAESGGVGELRTFMNELGIPGQRYNVHALSLRSSREEWVQEMSMWSRDNAVTLTRQSDGREILLLPRSFRDDGQLDAYLNRIIIQSSGAAPAFLAETVPDLIVRRSQLDFEGGDVVANGRHVLISAATIADNARDLELSQDEVVARFEAEFGRQVISVDPEPDFHIDMGVTLLDDHTAAVADPGLALELLDGDGTGLPAGELATMRSTSEKKELQSKYDRLAQTLSEHGYRVVRMPNLAGEALRSPYLTYQNVLLENFDGVKRVYMPVYGVPSTDAAARAAYEAEGFEVVPIEAALLSTRLGGAIRCAVGELDVLN